MYILYSISVTSHGKNSFAETVCNLISYISKNNYVEHYQNNYVCLNIMIML